METIRSEYLNDSIRIYYFDGVISGSKKSNSIRWLLNKGINFKRKLGITGALVAYKLLTLEELSDAHISPVCIRAIIKYRENNNEEERWNELEQEIKEILKPL